MAPTKTQTRDTTADVAFLTRALKAPTLRDSSPTGGTRQVENWTHEEFLVACLQREVASANPTAVKAASVPPASPAARAWKSSTSTTLAASRGT